MYSFISVEKINKDLGPSKNYIKFLIYLELTLEKFLLKNI